MTSQTSTSATSAIRPMLALRSDKAGPLRFPYLCQPKLDGIRAIIRNGQFQSRSGEPIANRRIQALLADSPELRVLLEGVDGEMVVGPPTDPHSYRRTASVVNSHLGGLAEFTFWAFDLVPDDRPEQPASERRERLLSVVDAVRDFPQDRWVRALHTTLAAHDGELRAFEEWVVGQGFEGIVARQVDAPYHHGRAGKRRHQLLKFKRFEDVELEIVGVEELLRNGNVDERSELGYAKRSTARAGKTHGGTLGALICRWGEGTVRVGTGFTNAEREQLWARPPIGLLAKVRHMPHGMHERPRHPSYQGLRAPNDLGGD